MKIIKKVQSNLHDDINKENKLWVIRCAGLPELDIILPIIHLHSCEIHTYV